MGFELGGHPKKSTKTGPSGPAVSSFKLGGSHLSGRGTTRPSPSSGGGLLGKIGGAIEHTVSGAKDVGLNVAGGLAAIGETAGKTFYYDARYGPTSGKATAQRKKLADLETEIGKSTYETYRHPLRSPVDTVLNTVGLAAGGAGGVARVAAASKVARAGSEAGKVAKAGEVVKALAKTPQPGPRVLKVNDLEVPGHYSRSALARGVQKASDAVLQKGAERSVRVEDRLHKRAAKFNDRNERVADAAARAPGNRLAALGAKLTPAEQRALRLVAEEVPAGRRLGAQEMRAARASGKEAARHRERIGLTKAAMEHLTEDAAGRPVLSPTARPILHRTLDALRAASTDREQMLKNLNLMDEAAQQAAKDKVAFVAAGGEAKDFTPAPATDYRMTHESPDAESGAPASDLTGGGEIYPSNVYGPNGYRIYGHGEPTLDKQTMKILHGLRGKPDAEVAIYRAVPKGVKEIHPGDWVTPNKQYAAMHAASNVENAHILEKKVPAREIFTNGDSIHEFGWHPAGANISVSPDAPFIGNPVERTKLLGKPKVSSGRTFGHTRKPGSLKRSTGASVEHALERNDVTNIVAERHAETVRLAKIDRATQRLAKAGEKQPRRPDDVWVWTDKTVSSERIPPEVRKYLDNPESLAASNERERNGILAKLKEATLERHDWQADPEARAEFEKLAAAGKGVFVPRRLMGEVARREYNVGHIPVVDQINNAQKAALIYLKASYPIAQAISNTGMNLIQQGFAAPRNLTAAARLAHRVGPEYAAFTDDVMGQGAVIQAAFEGQGTIARATQKIAHVMSNRVDTPARRAAFIHEAAKAGYNTAAKYRSLFDDPRHAGDLAEVAQRAKEAIVDYGDLTPFEKNVVRRIVFVYPWQKGAVKYAGHFLRDHPVQAAVLAQVGQIGKQRSQEAFGPLPSYLQGAIPVAGGLVNPTSVNQFQTPVQIGEALQGLVSGNPASPTGAGFLTPAFALGVALATRRDDLGFPLKGNLAQNVRDELVAPAPIVQAAGAALRGTPASGLAQALLGARGPSRSFPNPGDPIPRLLLGGLYPRQYNRGALNQNAAREKSGPR